MFDDDMFVEEDSSHGEKGMDEGKGNIGMDEGNGNTGMDEGKGMEEDLGDGMSVDDPVDQLCSMGFQKEASRKALKLSGGHIEGAIEILTGNV